MKNKHFLSLFLLFAAFLVGCANQPTSIFYDEPYSDKNAELSAMSENETNERSPSIYVSIQGAVCKPGVYIMPAGSRVFELINKAGGVTDTAQTSDINMVYVLEDGMQLIIPSSLDEEEQYIVSDDLTAIPDKPSVTDSGLVNINKASLQELTSLPGIGETRAKAIIAYRDNGGIFEKPEDIMKVSGIKAGIYEALKDNICVR